MECSEGQPRDGSGERKPEADLVRFESRRVGGLWRHRRVKWVFELTRKAKGLLFGRR